MWSYYGSKCKLAKHYPAPKYNLIIEPFAGSAWYSVLYKNKKIHLNEYNHTIYGIWDWLLNRATVKDILSYKDFYLGQDIRTLSIPIEHKNLIGFCINRGSTTPANIVQKWSCQVKVKPEWASTTSFQLTRIANFLSEINHWKIYFGDYKNLPNIEATWFIDPPYQRGGDRYVIHDIDYIELAEWCKTRKGQVIVCENVKAKWLPFKPFIKNIGQRTTITEGIWLNTIN